MYYIIYKEDGDDPILFEPLHHVQDAVNKVTDLIEVGYLAEEKLELSDSEKEQISKYHYFITPGGAWYIKRVRTLP